MGAYDAAVEVAVRSTSRRVDAPRCRCGRRLAEFLTTPYSLRCHSCKAQVVST